LGVTYLPVIAFAVIAVFAGLVGFGMAYPELAVVVVAMGAALADLHR
jgi:hypothetical protein